MSDKPAAIVLLSGGLDSATTLAIAQADGLDAHALSFRYGQRHALELHAASRVAVSRGVRSHRIVEIDLRVFGGSALTAAIEVPKDGAGAPGVIPITYVPARNTIFLSYALAMAEVTGAGHIYIGVNAVDYSGYPDCRPAYLEAMQRVADLATRAGVEGRGPRIQAPLLHLRKDEIIERGLALGVNFAQTLSCYDPSESGLACGRCDACRLRLAGFARLGLVDPAPYQR